jgi:hypothetical protein
VSQLRCTLACATTTTRPARRTGYRCARRRGGVAAGLVSEHSGSFAAAGGAVARDGVATGGTSAPFGLPVLAEAPRLASVLGHLDVADRAQLAAVAELSDLLAGDEVERTTGVGVDHWLAGLTCTTVPSTWRPHGDPRHHHPRGCQHHRYDRQRHRRRSDGPDPPGPARPGKSPRARAADDLPF